LLPIKIIGDELVVGYHLSGVRREGDPAKLLSEVVRGHRDELDRLLHDATFARARSTAGGAREGSCTRSGPATRASTVCWSWNEQTSTPPANHHIMSNARADHSRLPMARSSNDSFGSVEIVPYTTRSTRTRRNRTCRTALTQSLAARRRDHIVPTSTVQAMPSAWCWPELEGKLTATRCRARCPSLGTDLTFTARKRCRWPRSTPAMSRRRGPLRGNHQLQRDPIVSFGIGTRPFLHLDAPLTKDRPRSGSCWVRQQWGLYSTACSPGQTGRCRPRCEDLDDAARRGVIGRRCSSRADLNVAARNRRRQDDTDYGRIGGPAEIQGPRHSEPCCLFLAPSAVQGAPDPN